MRGLATDREAPLKRLVEGDTVSEEITHALGRLACHAVRQFLVEPNSRFKAGQSLVLLEDAELTGKISALNADIDSSDIAVTASLVGLIDDQPPFRAKPGAQSGGARRACVSPPAALAEDSLAGQLLQRRLCLADDLGAVHPHEHRAAGRCVRTRLGEVTAIGAA